ncbi:MAG: hypothetical protein ACXAC2_00620 [Candidatus Kariarchaeaceae archaeon]|jgi:hypothetical protein
MEEYKELVQDIINLLSGPLSPTTKFATVDNVVELVEEVLGDYQAKLDQLSEIKELVDGMFSYSKM